MESLRVAVSYISSFFKSEWQLEDYPLRFTEQAVDGGDQSTRRKLPRWNVQIINWWQMSGLGETRDEALEQLRQSFEGQREKRDLPRPGTGLPIEFASTEEIMRYEGVALHFFPEILGLEWEDCFVSDESSLWDFCEDRSLDGYYHAISQTFAIDVSDVEDGNLAAIFKRIHEARSA